MKDQNIVSQKISKGVKNLRKKITLLLSLMLVLTFGSAIAAAADQPSDQISAAQNDENGKTGLVVQKDVTSDGQPPVTSDNLPAKFNEEVKYNVWVINIGDPTTALTATNIHVTDKLPDGFAYSTHFASVGTYDQTTGEWSIDPSYSLAPLPTENDWVGKVYPYLYIYGAVKKTGTIINTATVTSNIGGNSDSTTITVAPADVYVTTSVDKTNPTIGETVKITFKVGNKGQDTAYNTILQLKIPEGLKYISATLAENYGTFNYDPQTNTITWNLGNLPIIDPTMYLYAQVVKSGTITILPTLSAANDPNTANIEPVTINAVQAATVKIISTVNAKGTIGMQETGAPFAAMALAILMVLGGFISTRKK